MHPYPREVPVARNMWLALVCILALTAHAAPDPAGAITAAQKQLANRQYGEAFRILSDGRTGAQAIADPAGRSAAMSAIHFLSAVALSELNRREDATAELRAFFEIRPTATLAQGTFPESFTRLFEEVKRDAARDREAAGSFDGAYPGFGALIEPADIPLDRWGTTSAAILLATDNEKTAFSRLEDDGARSAFINAFWRKRDPDPATDINEFREKIEPRIAFADVMFDEHGDRHGALSDRGRVFVLIGKPHRVTTRPLSRQEAMSVTGRGMRGGGVEVWEYRHEQLPSSVPAHQVVFRFVASGNDPRRILQRDFMAMTALEAAKKATAPDGNS